MEGGSKGTETHHPLSITWWGSLSAAGAGKPVRMEGTMDGTK